MAAMRIGDWRDYRARSYRPPMNRTTAFSVAAGRSLALRPRRCGRRGFQLWISESLAAAVSACQGTLELSQRFRESGDQSAARAPASPAVAGSVIGGGAAYVSTIGPRDEFRPHQQLTLTFGPLRLRTRVETRSSNRPTGWELRLRSGIGGHGAGFAAPQGPDLPASCCTSRGRSTRARGAHVDQWRAQWHAGRATWPRSS
jgi:hypothetical protein